mmetsp:Transcript_111559/g.360072  ORF Transcript_111559/g.360072 Transcript_111559/m.360072 type:complete len:276 (+) Transcript_111559:941-1768(+)
MSVTSSTAKTSRSSASTCTFSFSPSSSFFLAAAAALRFAGSLNSCCFFFHALRLFVHSAHLPLNHSEGCRSSTRCVSFLSNTHFRRCSWQPASSAHANFTSSKPSSFEASVNLAYDDASSFWLRSGVSFLRKHSCFSSSVSSTLISSSCSSSLASTSIFASSSACFVSASSSSPSFLPSFAFFAASSFFFRSSSSFFFLASSAFFRAASAFFRLASASAFPLFSFRMDSCSQALYSAGASPITTCATLRNSGPANCPKTAFRSSASRFPFTSMTT